MRGRSSPERADKNEVGHLHKHELDMICRNALRISLRRLTDTRRWPECPPAKKGTIPCTQTASQTVCQSLLGEYDLRISLCTEEDAGRELRSGCMGIMGQSSYRKHVANVGGARSYFFTAILNATCYAIQTIPPMSFLHDPSGAGAVSLSCVCLLIV